MHRLSQIQEEMTVLQKQLEQLRNELKTLQANCIHDFQNNDNGYTQTCTKCHTTESLNW